MSQPSKGEPSSTEIFPKQDSGSSDGSLGAWAGGRRPLVPGTRGVYSLRKRSAGEPFAAAGRRPRGGEGLLPRPGCPSAAGAPAQSSRRTPPPPSPCAAAQAPPRLAGPGKEAPGDWPRVTCREVSGWRLAVGLVRHQGPRSPGSSGLPPTYTPPSPRRDGGGGSQGNSLHQLARHHLILAAPELRSSMLITDGCCRQKVVPVARGRWESRKHYSLPVNKSLGVFYLSVERPWA